MTGTSVIHFVGVRADIKEHRQRRPVLKDMIESAQKAGLTVKAATITGDTVKLEFGGPTQAASDESWDKVIEKIGNRRRR